MTGPADNLLTKRQLCAVLNISTASFERWLRHEIMPPAKLTKKRAAGGRDQRFWGPEIIPSLLTIAADFRDLSLCALASKWARWWVTNAPANIPGAADNL